MTSSWATRIRIIQRLLTKKEKHHCHRQDSNLQSDVQTITKLMTSTSSHLISPNRLTVSSTTWSQAAPRLKRISMVREWWPSSEWKEGLKMVGLIRFSYYGMALDLGNSMIISLTTLRMRLRGWGDLMWIGVRDVAASSGYAITSCWPSLPYFSSFHKVSINGERLKTKKFSIWVKVKSPIMIQI